MTRSLPKVASRMRRKKVIKAAKGYFGRKKSTIKAARQQVEKGLQYAYNDRRIKKRDFRAMWIARINAGCRELGFTYGRLIDGMKKSNININRKILSEMAIHNPAGFKSVVEQAKAALK